MQDLIVPIIYRIHTILHTTPNLYSYVKIKNIFIVFNIVPPLLSHIIFTIMKDGLSLQCIQYK